MTSLTIVAVVGVVFLVVWYLASPAIQAYRRFRGQLVVTCPETGLPVSARVDAGHLASEAAKRSWDLRIQSCSRWPEREDCDQACLCEIEENPVSCLVRERLREWYSDRSCVKCGRSFSNVDSYDHVAWVSYDKKPALIDPQDQSIVEWSNVSPTDLLNRLETHEPICWDCTIIETFRRAHPENVTDRDFTFRHLHF